MKPARLLSSSNTVSCSGEIFTETPAPAVTKTDSKRAQNRSLLSIEAYLRLRRFGLLR